MLTGGRDHGYRPLIPILAPAGFDNPMPGGWVDIDGVEQTQAQP